MRNASISVENDFSRGLITEASALNFPENATTDALNVVFRNDKTVWRRLGIDYEDGYVNTTISRGNVGLGVNDFACAFTTYNWQSAASVEDLDFVVVQVGDTLYFYRSFQDQAISPGIQPFTVSLQSFVAAGAPATSGFHCQFASGNGLLFVSHPYCEPFYIQYDEDNFSLTSVQIDVKIRDFSGVYSSGSTVVYSGSHGHTEVVDEANIQSRPSVLTKTHEYNLYNQGWFGTSSNVTTANVVIGTLDWFKAQSPGSVYPANCDIWWSYKDFSSWGLHPNSIPALGTTNTSAPKGHYIFDAFNIDRNITLSTLNEYGLAGTGVITGLDVESSGFQRPSTIEFFASRVWYAGVSSEGFSNKIYFSQIIERTGQVGLCHQAEDPTSENFHDLLPNDGGVIIIPDIGNVFKLFATQGNLLVFASNGVWSISGSTGIGFTANDYSVKKVSFINAISANTFISVGGYPIWWNAEGIYLIKTDTNTGAIQFNSLTEGTIRTFFNNIPIEAKKTASGAFENTTNTVRWVYRSSSGNDNQIFNCDRMLSINLNTGAFSPGAIDITSTSVPFINGIIAPRCKHQIREVYTGTGLSNRTVTGEDAVTRSEATVIDSSGNTVVVGGNDYISSLSSFRYLCTKFVTPTLTNNYTMTFADEYKTTYKDWATALGTSGIDYSSYVITGYKIHGKGLLKFQGNYIEPYLLRETNSSCFMQVIPDFATSTSSNRYSTAEQIYYDNFLYGVVSSRKKLRTNAKSIQIKFYSETGKPFNLIGWAIWETGNAQP